MPTLRGGVTGPNVEAADRYIYYPGTGVLAPDEIHESDHKSVNDVAYQENGVTIHSSRHDGGAIDAGASLHEEPRGIQT